MGGGKYLEEGKSHKEIKPRNEETLRQGRRSSKEEKKIEGGNNFKEGKTFNVGKSLYGGKIYKKENL